MSISVRRQQSKKRVGASAEDIWEKFKQKFRRNPVDESELVNFSKKLKGEVLPFGKAKALFTQKREQGEISDITKLPPAKFHKDENVLLKGDRYGTIKYVGVLHSQEGLWYGIELQQGFAGDCDGSLDGYSYFSVEEGRGIFVREDDIRRKMTARDHKRSTSFQPHIDWKSQNIQTEAPENRGPEDDDKELDENHQIVLDEEIKIIEEDTEPQLRSNRLKEFKSALQNPFYKKMTPDETANLSYHDWPDRANELCSQKNYERVVDGVFKFRDKKVEGPLVGEGVNRIDPADYKQLLGNDVKWPAHLFELSTDLSNFYEVSQTDAMCMQPSTAINTCLTPIVVVVNDHVHGWFYSSKMTGDFYGRYVQPSGTFKSIAKKGVVQLDRGPLHTVRLSIGMAATYKINENLCLSFSCRNPQRTIAAGLLIAEERELENIVIVPIKKSDFNEVDMKLFRKKGSDDMSGVRVDIYRWEPTREESNKHKRGSSKIASTHPVYKWQKELLLHWQSEGVASTRMLIRQVLGRGVVHMQELQINEDIFQESSEEDVRLVVDSIAKRSWDPLVIQPLLEFLTELWGERREYCDALACAVANGEFSSAAKYFLDKNTKAPLQLFEQMAPFFEGNNNVGRLVESDQSEIYLALESVNPTLLGSLLLVRDNNGLTPLHYATSEEAANLVLDTLKKNNTLLLDMLGIMSINMSYDDVFRKGTIIHKYCSLGWIKTLTRIMDLGIELQSLLLDRNSNSDLPFELIKKNQTLLKKFFALFMSIQPAVRQKIEFYWSKKKAQMDPKEATKNPLEVFAKSH